MARQFSRPFLTRQTTTRTQGAFLISILLALAALTHTAIAQDWSKLPELSVWYEEVNGIGGSGLSYLPDFDIANGGKNALYCGGKVIYNRFKGDTATMFNFAGGSKVLYGDYNGDGIRDYFTNHYHMYQGVKNGAPPKPQYVSRYYDGYSHFAFITSTDINQDGKDDIVFASSSFPDTVQPKGIGTVLVGGDDLRQLERIKLPCTPTMYNDLSRVRVEEQCLMDAYYLEGKGMRIITLTWIRDKKAGGITQGTLRLWSVALSGTQNNRTVKYELLTSYSLEGGDAIYAYPYLFKAYNQAKPEVHGFKLSPITFNLINDTFSQVSFGIQQGSGGTRISLQSVRGESHFTWLDARPKNGELQLLCFDGNPSQPQLPFAYLPCYIPYPGESDKLNVYDFHTIGDVNGDGLNEIACAYTNSRMRIFRIYFGMDGTTSVIENPNTQLQLEFPQPMQATKPVLLRITINEAMRGTLTLYTQRGEIAATVWSGDLNSGENAIPFDAQRLGVGRGWYNIRLQAGATVLDKPIIIE
ncbi:MAG: VCBS repeat-containing protein [Candidatus Kapabacteria bacterium]|nr:VCBS repeat-containing protein [Candidatus Kapabacteria bacterium]